MSNKSGIVSYKKAIQLAGNTKCQNEDKEILRLAKEKKIFAFVFPPNPGFQIPAFQFTEDGVHSIVPDICRILDGLNDIGVYRWLNTYNEDLMCKPYQAISKPELYDSLTYLAGIFKSESTLRHL